ncbi:MULTISPECIES: Spx/MgsR family RNA polymerase-binding regulatory protein [Aneurinibacillus]|jgi:regulatory protein spx|uniref:Regulatory protein spx n=1 Tax=Aneurinibacillus thermoaerophilus TaxID=143495 RepID=A0A1G7W7A1_ANETH|nr:MULTISPECIES: Spx/MgsR family RNA polymerase-binding regulatory protein [Aneurinibacillus]AMA72556.1 transcriptional regulator [Aneurinibacillus sp. XH2]MED0674742.1 Spx/MgsR family RNA polymerase-binding regulatory protein [Aneurinibacillus thermoaerophilus]MED0680225.1 Spx/MgsR family RNA polymerase-binding regulatory protein [Aneurinibacillus thermoaerophilus]MED0736826.1 Spx/MgsR family RNA polymerase-binding regulatory protein [Aneurinibacillus thermoaerophilus]MED0756667.1 Spx/MgsR fa
MSGHLTFYTYPSCTSCRKAKAFLKENGIPYDERHLFKNPPSVEELLEIIKMTNNGTDDILSTRSRKFKELDKNIEEMTVSELLEMVSEEPRLLRRPIIFDGENLIIGYNRNAMQELLA